MRTLGSLLIILILPVDGGGLFSSRIRAVPHSLMKTPWYLYLPG